MPPGTCLIHPVEDVSQATGSAPLSGHDVYQTVKAGQVGNVELRGALVPVLDLCRKILYINLAGLNWGPS